MSGQRRPCGCHGCLRKTAQRLGDEGTLVFVGDGIKDRQLLAFAEPGVALGGFRTTDVYDTTDVIIMPEAPSRVVPLLDTARRTFKLARANNLADKITAVLVTAKK